MFALVMELGILRYYTSSSMINKQSFVPCAHQKRRPQIIFRKSYPCLVGDDKVDPQILLGFPYGWVLPETTEVILDFQARRRLVSYSPVEPPLLWQTRTRSPSPLREACLPHRSAFPQAASEFGPVPPCCCDLLRRLDARYTTFRVSAEGPPPSGLDLVERFLTSSYRW